MSVFKDYSKYYNLLYKEKNYKAEVDYIINIVNQYQPDSKSILNLGCGTGSHDFIFSEKGYNVIGVDLSQEMIDVANAKKTNQQNLEFLQGDMRTIRLDKKVDVVISLFHVMSYQTTNADLLNAIQTAYYHLQQDGLFVFDCWYGPGVLTDIPTVRNKQFEDENYLIKRLSTPIMHPNKNCVDVEFNINVTDKATKEQFDLHEIHKMRYLFLPEMIYYLNNSGFELTLHEEWLTKKELTYHSWNATFVCRKK